MRFLVLVFILALGGFAFGQRFTVDRSAILLDGREFRVWGFNYDRDLNMRLLEEYWHTDWPTVVKHFHEMHDLGANTVRIHLQLHEFLESPEVPNERNLKRLGDLLKLAEETHVYLDLTGLCCFRSPLTPDWYTHADEETRWRIQQNFWKAIAGVCKDSGAVLCYDLMNEPIVPTSVRTPTNFLVGHLVDFYYCQFITLDPKGRKQDVIARDWIRAMKSAIREVDTGHLITVGILPNSISLRPGQSGFLPETVGKELDFLCTHLYPDAKHPWDDMNTLRGFAAAGKPVVIEETFLTCSTGQMKVFLDNARPLTAGTVGFFWGIPSKPAKSIGDAMIQVWLDFFKSRSEHYSQQ